MSIESCLYQLLWHTSEYCKQVSKKPRYEEESLKLHVVKAPGFSSQVWKAAMQGKLATTEQTAIWNPKSNDVTRYSSLTQMKNSIKP